jgi:hypothetical protein
MRYRHLADPRGAFQQSDDPASAKLAGGPGSGAAPDQTIIEMSAAMAIQLRLGQTGATRTCDVQRALTRMRMAPHSASHLPSRLYAPTALRADWSIKFTRRLEQRREALADDRRRFRSNGKIATGPRSCHRLPYSVSIISTELAHFRIADLFCAVSNTARWIRQTAALLNSKVLAFLAADTMPG